MSQSIKVAAEEIETMLNSAYDEASFSVKNNDYRTLSVTWLDGPVEETVEDFIYKKADSDQVSNYHFHRQESEQLTTAA